MVARVEKTEDGYVVALTPEMVRLWDLHEGSQVELQPMQAQSEVQYASAKEALEAFERTLPLHENTYRELAK